VTFLEYSGVFTMNRNSCTCIEGWVTFMEYPGVLSMNRNSCTKIEGRDTMLGAILKTSANF